MVAYRKGQWDKDYTLKRGYLVVIALRAPSSVMKMQDVMRDLLFCLKKTGMIEQQSDSGGQKYPVNENDTEKMQRFE